MPSLELRRGARSVFKTNGPWLFPLLELEEWLADNPTSTDGIELYDKIVGRAGALLIVRLGFRTVSTDLISELAIESFEAHGVSWKAAEVTERILCATESLLESTHDPDIAHKLIHERAAASRATGPDTGSPGEPSLLEVSDLNVLRGGRHVLSAIDLSIDPGDLVLVQGRNGAGKTTLLRVILGLLPAASGRVVFQGQSCGSAGWKRIRNQMAYVRQGTPETGMPVSVREVVEAGALSRVKRGSALHRATSDALEHTGTSTLERRRFRELSGGEQRRVSIARALAQEPKLLVLDEPTAGLDENSRRSLLDLVEETTRHAGVSVLMTSHDPFDRPLTAWRLNTIEDGRLS